LCLSYSSVIGLHFGLHFLYAAKGTERQNPARLAFLHLFAARGCSIIRPSGLQFKLFFKKLIPVLTPLLYQKAPEAQSFFSAPPVPKTHKITAAVLLGCLIGR
jgi:hypothetical protein